VSHDGSQQAPQADAGPLPSVPAMPSVPLSQIYRGRPYLLLESGLRHSLGWQDDRKAGPSFIVARLPRLSSVKVTERFPLTEQGWASAWRALADLDGSAAAAIAAMLAKREPSRRAAAALAALDAESLYCLRRVICNGASGGVPLAKGQAYDLRFLGDRIIVCPPHSVDAIVEVQYRDVEAVEVGGPGEVSKSPGDVLVLILALGLLGALLGLFVLGLLGLLLGAVVFGLAGAMVGAGSTKIETIVQIRGKDAEFYFLHTEKRPDALRIELSEPLRAIGNARAAQAGDPDEPAGLASGSVPDQLSQLASLLQRALITRDEFEHLKAKLLAES
jgi:hypothetical protein